MSSLFLIRPFIVELASVKNLERLLRRNRCSIPGVTQFEKDLRPQDMHTERHYISKTADLPSNIPYRGRIKGRKGTHLLHLRETGICAVISQYELPKGVGPWEMKRHIDKFIQMQNALKFQELLNDIGLQLETRSKLRLGKPVELIHTRGVGKDFLMEVAKVYGVHQKFIAERGGDYIRFHSKPLHIISTNAMKKPAARRMRARILHGLELGYGVNEFIRLGGKLQDTTPENLRIVLNCWNPFMLSGRGFVDSPLLSLPLLWFNRVTKIFNLRQKFREVVLNYLLNSVNSAYQLLNLTTALKELQVLSDPVILPSVNHVGPDVRENEMHVYRIIRDHFYEVRRNYSSSGYKNGSALTLSEIMKKLGLKSGRENLKVRSVLDSLVKRRLVVERENPGPGRGKGKKLYSLQLDEYEYKEELRKFILQKMPKDQDDVPVSYGFGGFTGGS